MKRCCLIGILMLAPPVPAIALTPLPDFKLDGYVATWYEIASIRGFLQSRCARDTRTEYSIGENGALILESKCLRADGSAERSEVRARPRSALAGSRPPVAALRPHPWPYARTIRRGPEERGRGAGRSAVRPVRDGADGADRRPAAVRAPVRHRAANDAAARADAGHFAVMATVRATVRTIGRPPALVAAAFALTVQLAGCEHQAAKDAAEDAAKPTFVCQLAGAPLIIRFEPGEVRLLTSNADRITLYQIPAASGIRYSNASLELRGKGTDLQYYSDSGVTPLVDCQPYVLPKPS